MFVDIDNYAVFYENFKYTMFINKRKMITDETKPRGHQFHAVSHPK